MWSWLIDFCATATVIAFYALAAATVMAFSDVHQFSFTITRSGVLHFAGATAVIGVFLFVAAVGLGIAGWIEVPPRK